MKQHYFNHFLCIILLSTLPSSYKQEAKAMFFETTKSKYVFNSFLYALGGVGYRINKVVNLLLVNFKYQEQMAKNKEKNIKESSLILQSE